MNKLYLYLASRKKAGIKMITVLQGKTIGPTVLKDISILNLPQIWENQIAEIIHDYRMDFEPWIESAKDFNYLKESLKFRGYSNLPMGFNSILNLPDYSNAPVANTNLCKTKKIMIKKIN